PFGLAAKLDGVGRDGFHYENMRCTGCGHENPPGGVYCQQCGVRLAASDSSASKREQSKACPRCTSMSPAEMRFCTTCGYAFEGAPAPAVVSSVRPAPVASARPPAQTARPARLVAVMKDGTDGRTFSLEETATDIGREEGSLILSDDPYLSRRHARIERRGDQFIVRDLESYNGVYARIREPVELSDGDMILIGQQVLRFELLSEIETPLGPASIGGVMVFGTPEVPRTARLAQYTTEGVCRDLHYLYREETTLGRENGDIVFTDDPFLSRKHASVTVDRAQKRYVLRDLGSSNGTAVRFRGERVLRHGDQVRVGRHLFRFDQPGAS
ncbi:MAG: FHA domain-containing protein, partial [Myxococcales bacterium]|nr:FHA domain-containing protein [Myxococcales bacterium]